MAHPVIYEIPTRVWLRKFGEGTKLLQVPDAYWQQLALLGVDWVWLMGVWQTGPNHHRYALEEGLRQAYSQALPDWSAKDVIGSPYAIDSYTLHEELGQPGDLAILKAKLEKLGLKLMLDFIPNHFHAESRWIAEAPEAFLHVQPGQTLADPHTCYHPPNAPHLALAHGKDPYFAAWQDTVQVNYAYPAAQTFMRSQLLKIAQNCHGVRCDMAMLLLPQVFANTWKRYLPEETPIADFWPKAIDEVREYHPGFCFVAEVYWDLEWELQQRGFDYTYDKRLLDRLHEGDIHGVKGHLKADLAFQNKSLRFLENHDENRALHTFRPDQAQAAALATYTVPGARFFFEGQWEGRRVRLPVQLGRTPKEYDPAERLEGAASVAEWLPGLEPVTRREPAFYKWLLQLLQREVIRKGQWQNLELPSDWPQHLLAWAWSNGQEEVRIFINYSAVAVQLPMQELLPGKGWVGEPEALPFDDNLHTRLHAYGWQVWASTV